MLSEREKLALRWALFGLLFFVLFGCASAVRLRHADGREVRCGPYYYTGTHAGAAAWRESQCIRDFQRQGFERAP